MAKNVVSYSSQGEPWKARVARHPAVLAAEGREVWEERRQEQGGRVVPPIGRGAVPDPTRRSGARAMSRPHRTVFISSTARSG